MFYFYLVESDFHLLTITVELSAKSMVNYLSQIKHMQKLTIDLKVKLERQEKLNGQFENSNQKTS